MPDAVASEIKIMSYPILKASLMDVSTQMEVSTPQNIKTFIPKLCNHILSSVS
jgi:hypothetical protein